MKPSPDDLPNHTPVWDALSELFLDTELDDADFERLGRSLADSPYTLDELETILYDEVYPVCISNLRSMVGEWAGFDRGALQAAILKQKQSWFQTPRFLQAGRWMIREKWSKIKAEIERSRK